MESAVCTLLKLLLSLSIMLVRVIPVASHYSLFLFTAVRCSLCYCTAVCLCPIDGCVAGSHLGSYRITMNMFVLYPGDTCMHFCWVNKCLGMGVLDYRVWVPSILTDNTKLFCKFISFSSHQQLLVAPDLHGHRLSDFSHSGGCVEFLWFLDLVCVSLGWVPFLTSAGHLVLFFCEVSV